MPSKPAASVEPTDPGGGDFAGRGANSVTSEPLGITPETAANARAEVRRIVADSRTSFQAGMRILPAARREAMYAIYAFCREVDDIADEPASNESKQQRLAAWRASIDALFVGNPSGAISIALAAPIAEYGLAKDDFLAVIEGMEMDAYEAVRAPSMAELDNYCDRVASAVGRLSVRAFGATEPEADDVAHHLGRALQLTNILRDLDEDAERGRLYLPAELLEAQGITTRDPESVLSHPGLAAACSALAQVTRGHYRDAAQALAHCDRRPMRPAIVMMEAYRRVLDALERRGWDRYAEPVSMSKLTKLWIVFWYGFI